MPSFEHTYVDQVRKLHKVLMNFGWALNPHFAVGMDLEELRSFAKGITASQRKTRDKAVAERLHRLLFRCSFHPRFRAYQVVRASTLPFLKDFSQHFESAHFHYFKRDYLSAVLTLIPAIEGTLRSHARETVEAVVSRRAARDQVDLTSDDALIPELIAAIRNRELPAEGAHPHDHSRAVLNRDLLFDVLTKWLFCSLKDAEAAGNFAITYLNRNGVVHLFKPECFYTQADVGRLFLIMDIYIEAVRHELMVPTSCFLPDPGNDQRVDAREAYYMALLLGELPVRIASDIERAFLMEHENYMFVEDFSPGRALVEDADNYERRLTEMLESFRNPPSASSDSDEEEPQG